jgi:hypothetical protein
MGAWFYAKEGQQRGPVETPELSAKFSLGELGAETLVWTDGMSDWLSADKTPAFSSFFSSPPPLTEAMARQALPLDVSIGSLFSEAWMVFKNNWLKLTLMFVVAYLILVAGIFVMIIPVLGWYLFFCIVVWLMYGFLASCLQAVDTGTVSFGTLFSKSRYFWMGGLAHLAFLFTVYPFFFLLYIPGLIVMLMFGPSLFLTADKNTPPFQALHDSYYLTRGHLLTLFLLLLLWIPIGLAGLLCLIIGVLPAYVFMVLMFTVFYRRLCPKGVL